MNQTEKWKRDGYLVFRGLFDTALIHQLQEACEEPLDQWQRESTAQGEPGTHCYRPTAWVMLHLNHPKYHRRHPERLAALLNAVSDPRVLRILDHIFGEHAVFTQINYYINPAASRLGSWHRDCQFQAKFSGQNETPMILREGDPPREIHMHIPLVSTAATEVVPGSHLRTDTSEEGRIRDEEPHSDKMPKALRLQLEPGDLAFFHVNALHRGLYSKEIPRRTIAVTLNRASDPRPITAEMMELRTGYVAAYQPWFLQPGYLDGCLPAARAFYQRFIDIYRAGWQPDYLKTLHRSLQKYFTKY
jgi:hypothetical protein